MTQDSATAVLDYWRSIGPAGWFEKNTAVDTEIGRRFGGLVERAAAGALAGWETQAEPALALLLLLDQFPRNLYREDARAWAADPLARRVAGDAIARGFDRAVEPALRAFFYLPYEHSESLADQDRAIERFEALKREHGDGDSLRWAEMHRDIIRRFGRFPHRNAVLGRESTAEEQAFLHDGGFRG